MEQDMTALEQIKEFRLILPADTSAIGLVLLRQIDTEDTTYMALDSTTVHIEGIDGFNTLTKDSYIFDVEANEWKLYEREENDE